MLKPGRWKKRRGLLIFTGLVVLVLGIALVVGAVTRYGRNFLPVRGLSAPAPRYVQPGDENDVGHLGTFAKWTKVEFSLEGPATTVMDEKNPFIIQVDVTFRGPNSQVFVIPAFYDGDGSGSYSGNVWKVRFLPSATGRWQFSSASSELSLAGYTGSFDVTEPEGCVPYEAGGLPDLNCAGLLQYETGQHYLKFADGPYWVKGGIDDPENFLGAAFGEWEKKREAIDFLGSHGVNSIYFITNNITPGDRNDTWPWLGKRAGEAKRQSDRFDIVKLQEWESFFEYVQHKGITLHFVLNDDSAWHNFDHYLYYREMVARFGHHPALIWNIGEEANEIYRESEIVRLAQLLRDLDPYNHPLTVHRKARWPFLGETAFDLASIQPGDGAGAFRSVVETPLNQIVRQHREQSAADGHPIPIMIDETPRVSRVNENTRLIMRSRILYPILLAGGNYELHYYDAYGQGGSVTLEELTPMLEEMRQARYFIESLPFQEMEPCNELVSASTEVPCLGQANEVYAVYSAGGVAFEIDLSDMPGEVSLQWFSPEEGGFSEPVFVKGGRSVRLSPPGGVEAVTILRKE